MDLTAHRLNSRRTVSGLTLVELLSVMCVIGLLVAIAIPQIAALANGRAQEVRHRRNAQELASVCACADAAGLNLVVKNDLEKTVRNIIEGGTAAHGPFKGRIFAVKGLVEEDVEGVKKYLTLTNDRLSYIAANHTAAP